MKSWSYGINSLYKTSFIELEEGSPFIFLLRRLNWELMGRISNEWLWVNVFMKIDYFCANKIKSRFIDVDYDKLREIFYEEDKEFWDEAEKRGEELKKEMERG